MQFVTLETEAIADLALQDKKNAGATINCTLLEAIGHAVYDQPVTVAGNRGIVALLSSAAQLEDWLFTASAIISDHTFRMPEALTLTWPGGPLQGTAQLPASKSESNRALIIQALAGGGSLTNLSDANDTQLMRRLLADSAADTLDAEDAGTVMRFLTAYLSVTNRQVHLTGTARMRERPIAVLVEALRQLGMQIDYRKRKGIRR